MTSTVRQVCIICGCKLEYPYFPKDRLISVATYNISPEEPNLPVIPYNILKCDSCHTVQTKYLGDVYEIYRHNHADGTGRTMLTMHDKVHKLIINSKNCIENILEIGSSKGILCDMILKSFPDMKYHVIDPAYMGDTEGRTIHYDLYENVDDSNIHANTLIMSHVFEHFYNPTEILEKIRKNIRITNIILVWPDLDYYLRNNVSHVLNTEHTFYISNENLIRLLENYDFSLQKSIGFMGHSQIYFFQRRPEPLPKQLLLQKGTVTEDIDLYFTSIQHNVAYFNKIISDTNHPVYIWPCSIHTIFLATFGLNISKCENILDNSPLKIGKKLYAYPVLCKSLYEVLDKNKPSTIILHGGVFNQEVHDYAMSKSNIKVILPIV